MPAEIPTEVKETLDAIQETTGEVNRIKSVVEDMKSNAVSSDEHKSLRETVEACKTELQELGIRVQKLGFDDADILRRDPEYEGMWRCAAQSEEFGKFSNEVVQKALTTGNVSEIVDDQFVPDLIRQVEQHGDARRVFRVVPLSGEVTTYPKQTAGVTVYNPAQGAAITASDPTFGTVSLTARKFAALVIMASEVVDDSSINVAMGELVGLMMAEGIAEKEDHVSFQGDGSAGDFNITGWLHDSGVTALTGASGKTTFAATLDYDFLVDLQHAVPLRGQMDKYFMHHTILGLIQKLKDDQNNPIWQQPAGNTPGLIIGRPYELINAMPTTGDGSQAGSPFIGYGDPKRGGYFGDRKRFEIVTSNERYLENDQVAIRGISRSSFGVAEEQRLALGESAAS